MDNKIEEDTLRVRLYHEFFRKNRDLFYRDSLEYHRRAHVYVEQGIHKIIFDSSNNGFKKSSHIDGNGKPRWGKMTDEEVKRYLKLKEIIR